MEKVKKLFEALQQTRSITEKKQIISDNADNKDFTETLVFLLSTDILTGISKKKLTKEVEPIAYTDNLDLGRFTWPRVRTYLEDHNTGTDKDIAYIQDFISHQPEDMQDFYRGLVTKSIRLGCDKKLVNSVIPGLIKTWEIQQAYPLSDYKLKPDEWISLSQKLNGIHGTAMNGKMISRQGKTMNGFSHILNEIEAIGLSDHFVDGELIRNNTDNIPDEENMRLTTSIVNSDNEDKTDIDFVVYEVMPKNEFENGCPLTYKQRLEEYLSEFEERLKKCDCKHVKIVDRYYSGTDHSQIQKWLNYTDSKGLEGCMLNRDTLYRRKRNNGILKVKSWKYCDLRVLSVAEGQGKYAGTLGKLIVSYKGNPVGISGMTDKQRDEFWSSPNEIIGKIITIKYKTESHDKNGVPSLNFASFVCVRFDKDTPSYE